MFKIQIKKKIPKLPKLETDLPFTEVEYIGHQAFVVQIQGHVHRYMIEGSNWVWRESLTKEDYERTKRFLTT